MTPEGREDLVGFTDGARESARDWRDLLLKLKRHGLDVPRAAAARHIASPFTEMVLLRTQFGPKRTRSDRAE